MNDIISRLTEYENDIKLLKNAIIVLEKNFCKIKSDIIDIYNQESVKKKEKGKKEKKEKVKKEKVKKEKKNHKVKKEQKESIFKKSSITLSSKVKEFFNINEINDNNEILVSKLNKKINAYLVDKDLIKDKKVYLNKDLKTLLKTKKRIIELDEILTIIIKVFN